MERSLGLAIAVLAAAALSVGAQEREASSPFFDCPYINYFDNDCPQLEREDGQAAPPQAQPEPEQPEVVEGREGENEWPEENLELLLRLFPKESLAPDTPPLYRLLLTRPTLENARRYVRWYSRRMDRIREVQGLIALAGGEFLAERAAAEQGR